MTTNPSALCVRKIITLQNNVGSRLVFQLDMEKTNNITRILRTSHKIEEVMEKGKVKEDMVDIILRIRM